MFLFSFLLLYTAYSCSGMLTDTDTKILGGMDAPDGAIKYQVSLQNLGSHFCGGSIIDEKWVITAAHCTINRPTKSFKVVVGINSLSSEGQQYTPDKIVIHSKFDNELFVNDISLIRIGNGIELNERVQPVALPTIDVVPGDTVTVTGWGRTTNDGPIPLNLQILNETVISELQCRLRYLLVKQPITSSHLCTRAPTSEGSCQGDSGGPLVKNGSLVGLVSWGPATCGHSNVTPDVNTRVYSFVDWIKEVIS